VARLPYAGYHIDKQPAEESTGGLMQKQESPGTGLFSLLINIHLFHELRRTQM